MTLTKERMIKRSNFPLCSVLSKTFSTKEKRHFELLSFKVANNISAERLPYTNKGIKKHSKR
jgi:hypothetical protein